MSGNPRILGKSASIRAIASPRTPSSRATHPVPRGTHPLAAESGRIGSSSNN
ncbi:hypothetical protein [Lyngbya sp. CCY1209]|uniref:hypothetical protein n=1 Tax=Lyngbya sp. CCY1209 TaxID=2886103 RepID=UPI002D20024A|nr:hypothetical protein [Lyngbya sp. CCY1209]MEB3885019.1 hypothetical protein [Lyngbya sp. CCY1209]